MLHLAVFDYLLRREYETYHKGKWNEKAEISSLLLCTEEKEIEASTEGCLCIVSDPEIVKGEGCRDKLPFLVILEEEEEKDSHKEGNAEVKATRENLTDGYYIFCKKGSTLKVISRIYTIFGDHMAWAHKIASPCDNRADFMNLVQLCERYLGVQIFMVDRHYHAVYNPLHRKENYFEVFFRDLDEDNNMTEDSINGLYLQDHDFDGTFKTRGLQLYNPREDILEDSYCYYYNIFQRDYYVGRFLFRVKEVIEDKEREQLFNLACAYLCEHYLKIFYPKANRSDLKVLKSLLLRMSDGEAADLKELATLLALPDWNIFQDYQVVKLSSKGYVMSEETLEYYIDKIENTFPGTIAMIRGNCIMVLCNLTRIKAMELRRKLPAFLRENLFEAGISQVYHNCMHFKAYSEQAAIALSIGKEKSPDKWLHTFEEYAFDYCLLQIRSEFNGEDLYHPAIRQLMAYDKTHTDISLVDTLKTYIYNHFNAKHTADLLHIHRTTFLYRMEKIESICHINLDDPKELLHILLSFELMGE